MYKNLKLENSWKEVLQDEFKKDYMINLFSFLEEEKKKGKTIYPSEGNIFSALNATPFEKVKVVIIGQDPYHGEGQAHGLSFSVNPKVKIPPSLVNIFKELHSDLGIEIPKDGYLINWATQGVLLLNNVLTVEASKAGSHHKRGWEAFTDKIIEELNEKRENLVFLLWGSPAHKKGAKINESKHLVLKSVHPSPLSSYRGFFGCRHFSLTNEFLVKHKIKPIDWKL